MLQQEFEALVGMKVDYKEFETINAVYMAADEDVNKFTFCKAWAKMNAKRIKTYKKAEAEKARYYDDMFDLEGAYQRARAGKWDGEEFADSFLSDKEVKLLYKYSKKVVNNMSDAWEALREIHGERKMF